MGEEVIRSDQTGKRNAESNSTKATEAGTRTRTGTGTGTGTEKKPTEKSSGLLSVNQEKPIEVEIPSEISEEQKKSERNAKRRENYAKKKAEEGGTVRKRKSKKSDTVDVTQLNILIGTISSLVASRPNMEIWLLTEKEIQSITEPLGRIIANNENLKAMSEHTDGIALMMACVTVFLPRVIATTKIKKENKKNAITGQSTNTTVGNKAGKIKSSGRANDKQSTSNIAGNGINLSWLGEPVS